MLVVFSLYPNFGKVHELSIGWKGVKLLPLWDIVTTGEPNCFHYAAATVITILYILIAFFISRSSWIDVFSHDGKKTASKIEVRRCLVKFFLFYQMSHYYFFFLVFLSNMYSTRPIAFELTFKHVRVFAL